MTPVSTRRGTACRAQSGQHPPLEQFGHPVSGSIPTVIRSFKSVVSKSLNGFLGTACRAPTGRTTRWQRNYYEHIIRNEESLARIRKYIANNPENWDSDDENPTIGFIFNMTRTHIIPEKEICWIPVFFVESKFGIFNLRPK